MSINIVIGGTVGGLFGAIGGDVLADTLLEGDPTGPIVRFLNQYDYCGPVGGAICGSTVGAFAGYTVDTILKTSSPQEVGPEGTDTGSN